MNTFVIIVPAISGAYLLFLCWMFNTYTASATLKYKMGPFLVGCASILASLKLGGVL